MADWAGKTLGKIHIDQLVARGGMAEVYVGTHESYGQVAVKILRGLLERDSAHLARFKRESEVIGELKHPNIVQMLDYYVVDETPCLVMEYVSGPTLAHYLKVLRDRNQHLPIGVVANLLAALASALDYAHEKGIVHRDIKPANVLLRSPSQNIQSQKTLPLNVQPILTDFGLVRLLDSTMHTTAGSVAGTPAYMSPEQARGEKVDKRTDIYSLGIMLYEMLSGAVPFQADTTFGMLMQHINEHPAPIKGISPDLQALLDRALAKDPALRYQSAGELANEFMAIFNGQTVSPGTLHIAQLARESAAANAAARPQPEEPRRTRWMRLGTEFVVVAAVVVALFFLIVRPNAAPPADPNVPVGRMRFSFSSAENDRITFSLADVPQPEENRHYAAWLVSDDETFRYVGDIAVDSTGNGGRVFTDRDGTNLLDGLRAVQITNEPNGASLIEPTGEVLYSSIFPPEALAEVRNVLVSFDGVPESEALLVGLYYYSGSYIDFAVHGSPDFPDYVPLLDAYEIGDEDLVRNRAEEIINLIVGDQSDLYGDYNGDDEINNGDSYGYGSLSNENRMGYLELTALHLQAAAEAADSTPNIREQSGNAQVCIPNMESWTNQILPLALQLASMPFGEEMEPVIQEISDLSTFLANGVDADSDGTIEAAQGECGALDAYYYSTYMADFPLLIGADRTPPTGR
ncbi:MAG TPA: protein kinase [Anaerolineales bacterium]|nr:protein kinase [Anaerolineales bacterium]